MFPALTIFCISIFFIGYSYIGYPILLTILSFLFPRPTRSANITPRISLIITARNEEKSIRAKLENALSLDYPRDKYEIIVASDASTDRTDEIVKCFSHQGVILHREDRHYGKTITQSRAVKHSIGEILIFSDATTIYEHHALRAIVRKFADPEFGCVAGQLVYLDPNSTVVGKGCSSYWNYEKIIKHFESQLGSLIGVSGCLYAVRRICHARLSDDMIDDFVIASEIRSQGLRTVYEPDAIAFEETNQESRAEFKMRVRIIKQTLSALSRYRTMFSFNHHRSYSFQMISHKIMRYLVPFFLITAFASNLSLVNQHPIFEYGFIAQSFLYSLALIGWTLTNFGFRRLGPLALPYYFLLVNVAILVAMLKLILGERYVIWEPIRDVEAPKIEPIRPFRNIKSEV
jgi:cellulose synthase/poly-beta-1,6-N-acetylglucosamine synthase-like glycosyltransferase